MNDVAGKPLRMRTAAIQSRHCKPTTCRRCGKATAVEEYSAFVEGVLVTDPLAICDGCKTAGLADLEKAFADAAEAVGGILVRVPGGQP